MYYVPYSSQKTNLAKNKNNLKDAGLGIFPKIMGVCKAKATIDVTGGVGLD